jgi:internalin A
VGSGLHIFVSYAHKDEALREELGTHLGMLKRQGLIEDWHDRKILPGSRWAIQIDEELKRSQVILLLVSADFISSDYCYGIEMDEAMKKEAEGEACVIPIIVRPCEWQQASFGALQALPKDGRPITTWTNADEAWLDAVSGIRRIVKEKLPNPS